MSQKIMPWITALPEVGDPILKKRGAIIKTLNEASELEARAAELRNRAHHAAFSLEADVRELWTDEEVQRARNGAGLQSTRWWESRLCDLIESAPQRADQGISTASFSDLLSSIRKDRAAAELSGPHFAQAHRLEKMEGMAEQMHKKFVAQAISAGAWVPEAVLSDYPGLRELPGPKWVAIGHEVRTVDQGDPPVVVARAMSSEQAGMIAALPELMRAVRVARPLIVDPSGRSMGDFAAALHAIELALEKMATGHEQGIAFPAALTTPGSTGSDVDEATKEVAANVGLKVNLASVGNPDHGQDPTRPLPGVPAYDLEVGSLQEASEACRNYIAAHDLGGGNWVGGRIVDGAGKDVGRVSYNGRVWDPQGANVIFEPSRSAKRMSRGPAM